MDLLSSQNPTEQTQPLENIDTNQVHKAKNIIRLVSFFIILFVAGGMLSFLISKKHEPTQNRIPKAIAFISPQPSITPQINFATKDTKIANSLEAPPLYPNVGWQDMTAESKTNDDTINHAMAFLKNYDYIFIPFSKGKFLKAKSSIEYLSVESYYLSQLKKEGWDTAKLQFDNFNLQSIIADGTCEGVMGYMGYKDGMVKLIAIQHKLISCGPPGPSDATPYPKDVKHFAQYTLFISDPTPIEEIADYIKTHPAK